MRRGSVSEQLVLWDIDGTLLNADGVGRDLYDVVFVQLFGRSIDAFAPMAGRTDRAIILETLTMAGVDEPRRYVDPFIAGLTAQAPSVREMVAIRGRALPGASEVLRGLQGRAHQSVLTGNIRPVAEVKLAAVGLADGLDLCIGAYGDDHEIRAELVPVARRRAAAVHGKSPAEFDGGATVVIGDTPLDIEAALASGARAVGVATGGDEPVHAIALRCQVRIEPLRRTYSDAEATGLIDLFGPRERWATTQRTFLWQHCTAMVPGFTGNTTVALPLDCTYDFEVAAAKYLHALRDGTLPLQFLFSGTIFVKSERGFSVQQVPWDCEYRYDMPVTVWRELIAQHYPNAGWVRLSHETIAALAGYKSEHGMLDLEDAVTSLLVANRETAR